MPQVVEMLLGVFFLWRRGKCNMLEQLHLTTANQLIRLAACVLSLFTKYNLYAKIEWIFNENVFNKEGIEWKQEKSKKNVENKKLCKQH